MKCKRCGAEMPDVKKTCSECGSFLEGYTLNNVTGEYGYRGADGNFYKSEEDCLQLDAAINIVSNSGHTCTSDWLKSLKQRYTLKAGDEHYELEEFAKIVRGNLTGISKAVQKLFEAKYLQLTGNKMYGGYKD